MRASSARASWFNCAWFQAFSRAIILLSAVLSDWTVASSATAAAASSTHPSNNPILIPELPYRDFYGSHDKRQMTKDTCAFGIHAVRRILPASAGEGA